MKKTVIISFMIMALQVSSQISLNNQNFIGFWEADLGNNQFFKVNFFQYTNTLYPEDDVVAGHYSLVTKDSSGNETIVYKSKIHFFGDSYLDFIIYGGVYDQTSYSGSIEDINFFNHKYKMLRGHLSMNITSGTGNVGSTASWKIKRTPGLRFKDDDREFVIPTNIVLTKTSN